MAGVFKSWYPGNAKLYFIIFLFSECLIYPLALWRVSAAAGNFSEAGTECHPASAGVGLQMQMSV